MVLLNEFTDLFIGTHNQKPKKSKKKWFGKQQDLKQNTPSKETTISVSVPSYSHNVKISGAQNEQSKHAFSVEVATRVAAEAAFASAQAAAELVRMTSVSRYVGKTKEEVAAIRIQTAFRGHMVCLPHRLKLYLIFTLHQIDIATRVLQCEIIRTVFCPLFTPPVFILYSIIIVPQVSTFAILI